MVCPAVPPRGACVFMPVLIVQTYCVPRPLLKAGGVAAPILGVGVKPKLSHEVPFQASRGSLEPGRA